MVVTGSQQHIVFPLNQEEEEKKTQQLASPCFLQTVNLLVYSLRNLQELTSPIVQISLEFSMERFKKQKDEKKDLLTRGVSQTQGTQHERYKVSLSLQKGRPVGCRVNYNSEQAHILEKYHRLWTFFK